VGNSAFDAFAEQELDGLLRYATVLTGDRELARDLVQDVLFKVFRRWSLVEAADHPRAYVRTMITRAFISWRRSWSARNVVLAIDELPERHSPGDHASAIAERDALWRQVTSLPRRQRSVLVLRYYEHLTDAEIAEVLGCSAVTVRGYAARALATLRVELPMTLTSTRETR
jgi:RNA polymerase sigma-70 factor (sigma-E family)